MLRMLAPLLLVLPLSLLPARSSAAHPESGYSVSTLAHGVKLTLTVPNRLYPRNALVRVTLTVKNVAGHTKYIRSGLESPSAYVLDDSGSEVYDPLEPLGDKTLITPMGPGLGSFPLRAGRVWQAHRYLVLRGDRIVYWMRLGRVGHGNAVTVQGRPALLRLTEEAAPRVSITSSPMLEATIIPPWAVSGPMLYNQQWSCQTGDSTYLSGSGWVAAKGSTVSGSEARANCSAKLQWRAIAGWLGHPVADVDYSEGAP